MKDLFTIQSEAGQLWSDIEPHIAFRDAEIERLTASLAEHQRLSDEAAAAAGAELATMHAALQAQDIAAVGESFARLATIANAVAEPVRARRAAALQAEEDTLRSRVAQIDAEQATLQ